ncbi:MAG TPA: hypothetical protein VMH81_35720 [Bryobacteraceae bacterium]|nr:hypothetical protein [Bryobacteraceae bacterium]
MKEDPKNPKLLYAGGELGLVVHPRENDLILATHGRSLWILDDVSPLQQVNDELLSRSAYLFGMRPALRYDGGGGRGGAWAAAATSLSWHRIRLTARPSRIT